MKRRRFSKVLFAGMAGMAGMYSPFVAGSRAKKKKSFIMTVNGPVRSEMVGTCLSHEHILVDFSGADKTNSKNWDIDQVISVVKPYLERANGFGVQTFFDATPAFLGRDPELLMRISMESGVNIVTNTGYYGAQNNKFLPKQAFDDSADQLAEKWIREWKKGVDNTPIRPGFIKIGVDSGPLSAIHMKLINAAAITHLQTGLTIASHTTGAKAAFEQLKLLNLKGVSSDAFIWVHAQEEKDLSKHVKAASQGAWISFDGIREDNAEEYVEMLLNMKSNNMIKKVLISHDAGWYSPGEEHGGSFTPYEAIFTSLIPQLRKRGFKLEDTDSLLIQNPLNAFLISVKKS